MQVKDIPITNLSMLISELEAFKTTDATVIHLLTAMTPEQVARFIQSNPILDGDDSLLGQIDDGVDGEAFRVVTEDHRGRREAVFFGKRQ